MIRLLRPGKYAKCAGSLCLRIHPYPLQGLRTFNNDTANTSTSGAEKAQNTASSETVDPKNPETAAEPKKDDHPPDNEATLKTDDISTPWYLRDDIKSSLLDENELILPEVPPHAPPLVTKFLNLLATDYGMDDLLLFDMTVLDETHEFRANNTNVDFVIIASGKSERHIFKAASELRSHIKHEYNVIPSIEGMVSSAKTPAMRRKLLRRARKGPSSTDNEYGRAANSWVLFHHENIDIHVLTKERRQDLNLEALWCALEDAHLYEHTPIEPVESDHIFSGGFSGFSRSRGLHTKAGIRNYSSGAIQGHLERLLSLPVGVDKSVLKNLKNEFDSEFLETSPDFHAKYQLYRTLHLVNPEMVSFGEAEAALLEKYTVSESLDMTSEKINDVTEYAKLLLDSPTTQTSSLEGADTALDKLSKFISVLYQFSPEKFSMTKNAEFIPLLWRMTHWETGPVISSTQVDDFISGKTLEVKPPGDSIKIASNDARNVLTLLEYSRKTKSLPGSYSPAFQELVLYTYGNAGKWKKFWAEWESMFFPDTPRPEDALTHYMRLVVFLSLVSVPSQNLHFFDYYWKNGSSVSGTFMASFEANGNKFKNNEEKTAFIKAIRVMMDSLDPNNSVFEKVRAWVAEIGVSLK